MRVLIKYSYLVILGLFLVKFFLIPFMEKQPIYQKYQMEKALKKAGYLKAGEHLDYFLGVHEVHLKGSTQ